jgi:uncharacterized protein YcbX
MKHARVNQLYFYPVKSLRGVMTSEMELNEKGPLWDRQWMIVDDKNKFITMRTYPQLTTLALHFYADSHIEISQEELGMVDFGLEEREGDAFDVTIWKDQVPAFEVSGEVSQFVSDFLKKPVKLVRMADSANRQFYSEFPDEGVRFVDSQPLLVISKESLSLLESKLGHQVAAQRFRPNILIENVAPHIEDEAKGLKIGSIPLVPIKPCFRCRITQVHPLTGEMGEEPLKTLETYRRNEEGKIAFGYYYSHRENGLLKVGDPVEVMATAFGHVF